MGGVWAPQIPRGNPKSQREIPNPKGNIPKVLGGGDTDRTSLNPRGNIPRFQREYSQNYNYGWVRKEGKGHPQISQGTSQIPKGTFLKFWGRHRRDIPNSRGNIPKSPLSPVPASPRFWGCWNVTFSSWRERTSPCRSVAHVPARFSPHF